MSKLPSNYWRQLAATAVSNIGDGMVHAAAPLLTLTLTGELRRNLVHQLCKERKFDF